MARSTQVHTKCDAFSTDWSSGTPLTASAMRMAENTSPVPERCPPKRAVCTVKDVQPRS